MMNLTPRAKPGRQVPKTKIAFDVEASFIDDLRQVTEEGVREHVWWETRGSLGVMHGSDVTREMAWEMAW